MWIEFKPVWVKMFGKEILLCGVYVDEDKGFTKCQVIGQEIEHWDTESGEVEIMNIIGRDE